MHKYKLSHFQYLSCPLDLIDYISTIKQSNLLRLSEG